jgi:uncharacterized protein (TIGR04255 family)
MSEPRILSRPPIVEAVLDIDCDMPPGQDLAALEAPARDAFRDPYPKFRTRFLHEGRIELRGGEVVPKVHSAKVGIQALQFLQHDEKQLVQIRAQGFSFNRLAPYSTLDDYLPEIERTWRLFVSLTFPVQIRIVRLRYINRIELQLSDGRIELADYLRVSPQLPDETGLTFAGFFNQHAAVEAGTGNTVNIILASQPSQKEGLPIILDLTVAATGAEEPEDWAWILSRIQSLRDLKNRVFWNTLTDRCLNLFQQ